MVASQRAGVGQGIVNDLRHGAHVLGRAPRTQWTPPPTCEPQRARLGALHCCTGCWAGHIFVPLRASLSSSLEEHLKVFRCGGSGGGYARGKVDLSCHLSLVMACHLLPLPAPVSFPLSIKVNMLWLPVPLPIFSQNPRANRNMSA